jgi:hypothetical protein
MRKTFYLDLAERALWTFAQSVAGTWLASSVVATTALMDLAASDRLSIALGAGLVSVAKVLVASQLPWTATNSGSTLPAALDPPADGTDPGPSPFDDV